MTPQPRAIGGIHPIAGKDPQTPAGVAVVITTVLRPSLLDALRSVYAQDFKGPIQVLIGVDKAREPIEPLRALLKTRPRNVEALVLNPGYSTAKRHGGVHLAPDGGAMRTILSYLANSRLITYLDDDNRWLPNHLSSLAAAIAGFDWAYSLRRFVDERTGRDLCVDVWDSVGPGKGNRRETLGGFVDPNCLMIDKSRAESALALWTLPTLQRGGSGADRRVFQHLRTRHSVAWTGRATVRYTIRPTFYLWPEIVKRVRRRKSQAPKPQRGNPGA
jgi:hypothetical protein